MNNIFHPHFSTPPHPTEMGAATKSGPLQTRQRDALLSHGITWNCSRLSPHVSQQPRHLGASGVPSNGTSEMLQCTTRLRGTYQLDSSASYIAFNLFCKQEFRAILNPSKDAGQEPSSWPWPARMSPKSFPQKFPVVSPTPHV
jgi:hypothetical protein